MKSGVLRAIGHNLCDSLVSGVGLPVAMRASDIFSEAASGEIAVDFLGGTISRGSEQLAAVVAAYAGYLEELCRAHGVRAEEFGELTARFGPERVSVTVRARDGRGWRDDYEGRPLRRPVSLDAMGRRRPVPGRRLDAGD